MNYQLKAVVTCGWILLSTGSFQLTISEMTSLTFFSYLNSLMLLQSGGGIISWLSTKNPNLLEDWPGHSSLLLSLPSNRTADKLRYPDNRKRIPCSQTKVRFRLCQDFSVTKWCMRMWSKDSWAVTEDSDSWREFKSSKTTVSKLKRSIWSDRISPGAKILAPPVIQGIFLFNHGI